jgi:hypothetical protein
MNVFFRVLTPTCGDMPGNIDRWDQGKHTSSHSREPWHWRGKWQQSHQSKNPDDYELTSNDGCRYTKEALATFLNCAHLSQPNKEQLFRMGEFEGLAAFDSAEEVLKYGDIGPLKERKLYVAFEGVKLAPLKEEGSDGACRVKFIREIIPPMDKNAFLHWLHRNTK